MCAHMCTNLVFSRKFSGDVYPKLIITSQRRKLGQFQTLLDKVPEKQAFFRAAFKLGRHVFLRSGAKTQNREYEQSIVGSSVQ